MDPTHPTLDSSSSSFPSSSSLNTTSNNIQEKSKNDINPVAQQQPILHQDNNESLPTTTISNHPNSSIHSSDNNNNNSITKNQGFNSTNTTNNNNSSSNTSNNDNDNSSNDDDDDDNDDNDDNDGPPPFEDVPTFYPTLEEMNDFNGLLKHIASKGINEIGLCKIVPPKEWIWQPDLIKAKTLKVRNPIQQCVTGRAGMYSVCNVVRKDLTVEQYEIKAKKVELPNRENMDPEEIERRFWKSLTTTAEAPLYGSDVLGTLFGNANVPFNPNQLDCILKSVGVDLPGITRPMMYVGMWRSFFPFHTEDMYLFSMSFLHHGAPKHWYGVRPGALHRLESLARGSWPEERCPEFMRHKTKMISPTRLAQGGIPFVRAIQRPGQIMVTWPGAYHGGFNSGFNIAEAVNFVPSSLYSLFLDMARKAGVCKCRPDSVRLDVEWLNDMVMGNNNNSSSSSNDLSQVVSGGRNMAGITTTSSTTTTASAMGMSGSRNMSGGGNNQQQQQPRKRNKRIGGGSGTGSSSTFELHVGMIVEWWNDGSSNNHNNSHHEKINNNISVADTSTAAVVMVGKWQRRKIVSIVDGFVRLHLANTHHDQDVWVNIGDDVLREVGMEATTITPITTENNTTTPMDVISTVEEATNPMLNLPIAPCEQMIHEVTNNNTFNMNSNHDQPGVLLSNSIAPPASSIIAVTENL
jgi:jumonji domain-containing protein 2